MREDSLRSIKSAVGGWCGDESDRTGATKTLISWLDKSEIVRLAAEDVVRANPDYNTEFWLAKFLWDVFYGNGLPFGYAHFAPGKVMFCSADFTRVVEYLRERM